MIGDVWWGVADSATVRSIELAQPGEVTDPLAAWNDFPAIVIETKDGTFVLEGTPAELLAFGRRVTELATAALPNLDLREAGA